MPRINEAYRVLGDPARRAAYDAALRVAPAPARTVTAPEPVRPAVDTTPARIPWRLMLVMAGVGVAIVLVGAALYEPAGPGATGQPPRTRIVRRPSRPTAMPGR